MEIIAEVGSSHNGSFEAARKLAEEACLAGANTVKFQLFRAESLYIPSDPNYEKIKKLEVPLWWLNQLQLVVGWCNREFLVTPFFLEAVVYLERLGVKRYKVASGDLTFVPLLEMIGQTKKPVLLSCGYARYDEVGRAINTLTENGTTDITLLHCNGGYPTVPEEMQINDLKAMIEDYNFWKPSSPINAIGYSSHVADWKYDLLAVGAGATVLEKHIRLDEPGGPEDAHSLTISQFAEYCRVMRTAEQAMKSGPFTRTDKSARVNARRNPADWLRPAGRQNAMGIVFTDGKGGLSGMLSE